MTCSSVISQIVQKALQRALGLTAFLFPPSWAPSSQSPTPSAPAGRVAAPCREPSWGSSPSRTPGPRSGCPRDLRTAGAGDVTEVGSAPQTLCSNLLDPVSRGSTPSGPGPPQRWAAALRNEWLRAILGSLSLIMCPQTAP